MDKNSLIRRIKEIYPSLEVDMTEMNMFGQNNHVIIINNMLVFRFPKYDNGVISMLKEVEILNLIKTKITVPIPIPVFISLDDTKPCKAFAGYRMLKGSPLWKDELFSTKEADRMKIAQQLTLFLKEIHSIPHESVSTHINQESSDPIDDVNTLYTKFKNKVYPYMSVDSRNSVSCQFESFMDNWRKQKIIPALIHGDFGASNILWDAETAKITGIIDFGGSRVGDPASDFAGLLSSYGEEFFNHCINLYPDGKSIAERVKFYRSTFALQEALHGIENNDEQAFKNGIRSYL